jgi:hypothetical protein
MRAGVVGARRVHSETMVIWPGFRLRDAAAIFAAGSLCVAAIFADATPARAQPRAQSQADAQSEVSLDYFHERLEPFGKWVNHPVWGEVWQPDAGPNFRPYFYGYWDYTSDYGSLWVSNEPYGDIVYHYGRWLFDMNYGWLWVPGYVWGPSWVVWRANQDYVGWLPMPPGYLDYDQPLRTAPYAGDNWYGYQTFYGPTFVSEYFYTLWVFVENNDFGRSDRRRYVIDIRRLRDLYHGSRDRTRYVNDRDRIVDRFIDPDWLKREAHRDVKAKPAFNFLHRNVPMNSVSKGADIFRRRHDANPTNTDPIVRSGVPSIAPTFRERAGGNTQNSTMENNAPLRQNNFGRGTLAPVPDSLSRSRFGRAPAEPTGDANAHPLLPGTERGRLRANGEGNANTNTNANAASPAPGFAPFNRAARGDSAGGATFGRRGLHENAPSTEGAPAVLPAVPNPGGAANPPRATANFGSPAAAPGMFHVPGAGGPLSRTTLPGPGPSIAAVPSVAPLPAAPAIVAPASPPPGPSSAPASNGSARGGASVGNSPFHRPGGF